MSNTHDVTLWYRLGEGDFEFNHLEDGHSQDTKPRPKVDCKLQNKWKASEWRREHARLINGVVRRIQLLEYSE